MTTPNENEVQGQQPDVTQDTGTDLSGSQQQDNGNDLYAPYLEKFPTSLHPIAMEVFKEWDGNVTKRIQSVHSEYEPYKPFVDQYEPDALQQAIALTEAMERDPQAFIQAAMQAYGIEQPVPQQQGQEFAQQTQETVEQEFDPSDPYAQRLQQHEQLLSTMAQALLSERQAKADADLVQQQETEYQNLMTELTQKHGEFDVNYVNALLAQGWEGEQAVQHWKSTLQSYSQQQLTPNNEAPVVLGAGGGTPSIQQPVENLSSVETRRLVEQMLAQAAEQGR